MATRVAAIIFLLVGVAHSSRFAFHFNLVIGNWPIPLWVSGLAGVVALALSVWLWKSSNKSHSDRCCNGILGSLVAAAFGVWIAVIWRADNPPLDLNLQAQPSGKGLQFDIFNWGQSPADGVCLSWSYLNKMSILTKSDVKAQYPYLGSVFPSFSSTVIMRKFTKTVAPDIKEGRKFDALVAILGQKSSLPFAPTGLVNRIFVFLTEDVNPYKFKSSLEDSDLANIHQIRNCISVYANCEWEFICNLGFYDRATNYFKKTFDFSKH